MLIRDCNAGICYECCEIFKNNFFIEHLRWLLLQVLYKNNVPKNFANFTKMYRYGSPSLWSCRPISCNFVKIEGVEQVLCCEFCDISQNYFMQNYFKQKNSKETVRQRTMENRTLEHRALEKRALEHRTIEQST